MCYSEHLRFQAVLITDIFPYCEVTDVTDVST